MHKHTSTSVFSQISQAHHFLERFVYHTLQGEGGDCGGIVAEAVNLGVSSEECVLEILWPTMECIQNLRRDGSITVRTFNSAIRTLVQILQFLVPRIHSITNKVIQGRVMLVITAPCEFDGLGAHIVAALGEGLGWRVHFAGAGLSMEEVAHSIGLLKPEVLAIHGHFVESALALQELLDHLHKVRHRPGLQVAVCGGVTQCAALDADLVGRDPVEVLELLALCPNYRSTQSLEKKKSLELMRESIGVSNEVIRKVMATHFRNLGLHRN